MLRNSKTFWLVAITIALSIMTSISGPLTDSFYLGGIFQAFRVLHDYTLGFLPIPSIYLALMLVLFLIIRLWRKPSNWKIRLIGLGKIITVLICIFYLFWGFNYKSSKVSKKLGLELERISETEMRELFIKQTKVLNSLSANVDSIPEENFLQLESGLRVRLEALLQELGYATIGRVRVRKIPKGLLLRLRTSGIYIPHALEGHVDGGLYPRQWPFTLAHEMAHGYGISQESDCNFLAYLVCKNSPNPNLQYSAELAYWRYLAGQMLQFDKEGFQSQKELLEPIVRGDLKKIRDYIDQYPELLGKYRNLIYNQYLKSHGIQDGLRNYDRMVLLIHAWNKKNESLN